MGDSVVVVLIQSLRVALPSDPSSFFQDKRISTRAAALVAATRNAAHSVGRGDVIGTLEPGKQADLQWYRAGEFSELPYLFGQMLPAAVIKAGEIVARDGEYL